MSKFKWGMRSKLRMMPLHPDAKRVLNRLITLSPVDITILETKRSITRQRTLVASGASKTMNSRHIPNGCGVVHAWDLGALVGGKLVWTWDVYEEIAEAEKEAAIEEGVQVRWGGCWEVLNTLDCHTSEAVDAYVARCRKAGRKPFLDGGHSELPAGRYP